jgi:low affinity Fe/Cu permease
MPAPPQASAFACREHIRGKALYQDCKCGPALQAKLDELIRVGEAENRFIGIEHLSESEVEQFRALCEKAAKAHGEKQKHNARRIGAV